MAKERETIFHKEKVVGPNLSFIFKLK